MRQWEREKFLNLCKTPNIAINWNMSDLEPKQVTTFLGMEIHWMILRVLLTQDRVSRLLETIENFLSWPCPPAQEWLVLLGHLSSLAWLVPGGRSRMRSLHFQTLGQKGDKQFLPDTIVSGSSGGPPVVVEHHHPVTVAVTGDREPRAFPVRRCVTRRLGRVHSGGGDKRQMVATRTKRTYYTARIKSDQIRSRSVRRQSAGTDDSNFFGQRHGCGLYQESRRHKVNQAQPWSPANITMGERQGCNHPYSVRKGREQRNGGPSQQKESDHLHRVEAASAGVWQPVEILGSPTRGSVHHTPELQAS